MAEEENGPIYQSDGTMRVDGDEFIKQLRAAVEWRIWNDELSEELVLAAKGLDGQIKTYKGPEPNQIGFVQLMEWMTEVASVAELPEIAERRR